LAPGHEDCLLDRPRVEAHESFRIDAIRRDLQPEVVHKSIATQAQMTTTKRDRERPTSCAEEQDCARIRGFHRRQVISDSNERGNPGGLVLALRQ
jgi:hypothetical protein